jgi:surface antigen
MLKYPKTALLAAMALLATAPAAFADHDHDRDHWEHERHGPPDWAPAHGRRHHEEEREREERVIVVPERRVIVEQPTVIVPAPAPQPVVVYPPWFVQQQGQYVYQQQYQPVAPAVAVNRCNSQAAGAVLGGLLGGVLGHQIGGGNGKTLATVGGAVTGMLVGGEIGRSMDASDQACVGQVLEVAPVGRRVQWVESGTTYVVVPQKVVMRHGNHCRPYTLQIQTHHGWRTTQGMACRRPGGVWVRA